MKSFKFFLLFPVLFSPAASNAQLAKSIELKERERISQLFVDHFPEFNDTVKTCAFSFKVQVERSGAEKPRVSSIESSDPIAEQLFPDQEFLKGIHYELFMGNKKQETFIFPVVFHVYSRDHPTPSAVLLEELKRYSHQIEDIANSVIFPCNYLVGDF